MFFWFLEKFRNWFDLVWSFYAKVIKKKRKQKRIRRKKKKKRENGDRPRQPVRPNFGGPLAKSNCYHTLSFSPSYRWTPRVRFFPNIPSSSPAPETAHDPLSFSPRSRARMAPATNISYSPTLPLPLPHFSDTETLQDLVNRSLNAEDFDGVHHRFRCG
jgi:hypothetical protein